MRPEFIVRPASPPDSKDISQLSAQLGYPAPPVAIRKRLSAIGKSRDHAVFIAETSEGSVAGWVHIFIRISVESDRFAEIGGLVVDEAHRTAGIGRLLVKACEGWARKKKCASVRVRTNVMRKETHQFYENLGYAIQKSQTVFQKKLARRA